jgi:predicted DNA-binding WGR domain protein
MNRPDYDFRNQEPVWVKYLINTHGDHDKYYECRIDMTDEGEFVLTKRWGRRPDSGGGQIKTEYFQSMARAMGAADAQINNKVRGGYSPIDRPDSADNKVRREYGPDYYDEDAEAF